MNSLTRQPTQGVDRDSPVRGRTIGRGVSAIFAKLGKTSSNPSEADLSHRTGNSRSAKPPPMWATEIQPRDSPRRIRWAYSRR